MTTSPDTAGNSSLKMWIRALEKTAPLMRDSASTLPVLIDGLAERFGANSALISEQDTLTYNGLAERSRKYARWALKQGLAVGDVVCLLMPNCAEYMAIWLGITRIGAIVSLINTNLTGGSLAHSIRIVAPKEIIVGAELAEALRDALPRLPAGVRLWAHGATDLSCRRIDHEILGLSGEPLSRSEHKPPAMADRALYIYTSGTTGLPKAANVSHFRLMQWSHWFSGLMDAGPTDRMYNCLPMYHSIGGVVAVGAMLVSGGAVVLRQRFSASRFWDDVVAWDCTLFQYIGELCRYLIHNPPHPRETSHTLRLCCGNGLRHDVWDEFQRRFNIPRILEFYAATEINFSLFNCEGKPGAIGRIPPFLAQRFPVALVRFDLETGQPMRGDDGFCRRSAVNETGEAIGRIADDANPAARFEGYTDAGASDAKILRNVFERGDAWLRTGDLMRRDEKGFFYFVDRVGDTFRWKGENVSTTEVAGTIAGCRGVVEAVVYGVSVPGADGRAGMAALMIDEAFDIALFHQRLTERLPEYARPLFLRIRGEIEMTATFKPKKQDLIRDGYDPAVTTDAIYYNDRSERSFVRLDAELYRRLTAAR